MSPVTIRVRNFRALRAFDWTPVGVSLLSGPNGAGKSTSLDVLRFLRALFTLGMERALMAVGGDHFRSRGTDAGDLVEFEVQVEDIRWVVRLAMTESGLKGTYGEELHHGSTVALRAAVFADSWYIGNGPPIPFDETRCCAKVLLDRGEAPWMERLVRALTDIRVYESFWINKVREGTSREEGAAFLHGSGKNLWAVLATWKQAPRTYDGQFDWVIRHARAAFPDLIESLEFDKEPMVFPPGVDDPAGALPARRQADGLLTGLLLLTAVAGAKPRSIIAIDEMENQLHPHAIRAILAAMRELAERRELTVIITTHSPIVMNEFKGFESQFFVLEPSSKGTVPTALDEARSEAWLSHFTLGDLYERGEISGVPGLSAPPESGT